MLDRLEAAFARQQRFTADASHELRTPLAVIRAEADLALRGERTTREYRSALEAIAAEAERIDALASMLLAAARADAGRAQASPTSMDDIARSASSRLATLAQARGVALSLATDGAPQVVADREALESALVAILHNAVKFAGEGGSVRCDVRADQHDASVTVIDNGPGFSDEALRAGLERFFRDRNGGGTGLGLAIASSAIEAAGGTIELANAPGGGARVEIRLPRAASAASRGR
jgi:two-component system OmpR family sensor kinase